MNGIIVLLFFFQSGGKLMLSFQADGRGQRASLGSVFLKRMQFPQSAEPPRSICSCPGPLVGVFPRGCPARACQPI